MKGYLANGLFSLGDRMLNAEIARQLREKIDSLELYVPQENEALNNKNGYADSITIADGDDEHLLSSDFLIAILDGSGDIDSGVACEIGKFSMLDKPIFALYSDVRQDGRTNALKINALVNDGTENQFSYINLYVVGTIKKQGCIFKTIDDLIEDVARYYKEKLFANSRDN